MGNGGEVTGRIANASFASSLTNWNIQVSGNYACVATTTSRGGMPTQGGVYAYVYTFNNYQMNPGDNGTLSQSVDLTGIASIKLDVLLYPSGTWLNKVRGELWIDNDRLWSQTVGGLYLNQTVDVSGYTGIHTIKLRSEAIVAGTYDSQWVCFDNLRTYSINGYFPSGNVTSTDITPSPFREWGALTFTKTTPASTAATVDVLNAAGDVLASNVASGTNLNSLGITTASIKLRANLSTNSSTVTPALQDWTVAWQATPDTTVESVWSAPVFSTQNSPPTDLTLSNSTVPENQPGGVAVGTLSTNDPDADNTFTYTLASGTSDDDNGSFAIAGSVLQTTASLDYETQRNYSVRIRTTDQGGLWYEEA